MTPVKWRMLSHVFGALGGALVIACALRGGSWSIPAAVAAAVFLAASLAVGAAKWRCPHCGKHISDRAPLSTSHCPFCGGSLREKSE